MSNIKFFEKIAGYPVIIPRKKCPAEELESFLTPFIGKQDVISITVQVDDVCDRKILLLLEEMSFRADEKEEVYCCDLTAWNHSRQLIDSYDIDCEFVSFSRCGLTPFSEIAKNAVRGDVYSFNQFFHQLKESPDFDPRLWEVLLFDGQPVGIVMAHIDAERIGTIDYIAVVEGEQGKGFGKLLHLRGMRLLKAYGAKRYVIEIDEDKLPFISLFREHDCQLERIRYLYIR